MQINTHYDKDQLVKCESDGVKAEFRVKDITIRINYGETDPRVVYSGDLLESEQSFDKDNNLKIKKHATVRLGIFNESELDKWNNNSIGT